MRLKFDFRGFRKAVVFAGISLLIMSGAAIAVLGSFWLSWQWLDVWGVMAWALLWVLVGIPFSAAWRKHPQSATIQADDQEQETAQPDQEEDAQIELDAIDRQILSVAIAHPEYTDMQIQQALTVSVVVETVRKKRNLFWDQGSPVFNAESLKRRKFKKDLHN